MFRTPVKLGADQIVYNSQIIGLSSLYKVLYCLPCNGIIPNKYVLCKVRTFVQYNEKETNVRIVRTFVVHIV